MCTFVFYLYGNAKVCFYLPIFSVFFSMKSKWNESCTESISYIQVSSSIIKDQIGVLSVLVSQPALEGHLVAEHWGKPGLVVKLFQAVTVIIMVTD